jgi:hypothetical protein
VFLNCLFVFSEEEKIKNLERNVAQLAEESCFHMLHSDQKEKQAV